MTQTLATNLDNDIYLDGAGNLAIALGLDAVLLLCAHAAKVVLGEAVLDTARGVAYKETVWIGIPEYAQFRASLRAALQDVQDVINVQSLTIGTRGDLLSYDATVKTAYGVGAISG